MKKAALVVLLTAMFMMLAVASANADALRSGAFYINWNPAAPNNAPATPHAGYGLTTTKCAVCHSVHNAPTTTGPESQLLLRSSVADACTYCHIDTAIGVTRIYDGVASNYNDDLTTNHDQVAMCTACHSVHSANTIGGAVQEKILKDGQAVATFVYQDEYQTYTGLATEAAVDGATRDVQVTMFCTRCHDMFSPASETTVTASILGGAAAAVKHHPMTTATADFDAAGATIGINKTVAWVDAFYCRSCHDAGAINSGGGLITSSWPHYTPGAASFLLAGTDAASRPTSGSTTAADGAPIASQDGACIKCHIQGAGPGWGGVGSSY
ncbi:MAG: hypothetical protein OEV43_08485 [Coriobacteriia bacterium]|nr:hypothetical protein [Coriobacteriia bacterium]